MQANDSRIKKLALPIVVIVLLIVMVAWMAGVFSDKLLQGIESVVRREALFALAKKGRKKSGEWRETPHKRNW